MYANYFRDQICEELDGACDYLKKAVDFMSTRPDFAQHFIEMSDMEEGHATTLYRMFMDLYMEDGGKDRYMTQARDRIMDCFSSKMRKLEDLRAAYGIIKHEEAVNTPQPTLIMR